MVTAGFRRSLLATSVLVSCWQSHVLAFSSSTLHRGVQRRDSYVFKTDLMRPSKENSWRSKKRIDSMSMSSIIGDPATSRLFDEKVHGEERKVSQSWLSKRSRMRRALRHTLRYIARKTIIGLFCLITIWSLAARDAFAVSGGRMGGSFKSSPGRAPISRSYRAPSPSYRHRPPSTIMMRPYPRTRMYYQDPVVQPQVVTTGTYGPPVRRHFGAGDIAFITGAGLLVSHGVSNQLKKEREQNSSALGPGFSVARLTVSLNVPDRDAPNSILTKLKRLSATSRTDTRQGVQKLVSSVALELLRQEKSIRSAETEYQYYQQEGAAQHEFMRQSIQQRSKFDRETVNKYGTEDLSEVYNSNKGSNSKATEALVTILIAIEGNTSKLVPIKNRDSVLAALNRLAVDAQVDDCLLSAEVAWSPEDRSETVSQQDVFADYPSLFPI